MIIGKLCLNVLIIKKLLKHSARESAGWMESLFQNSAIIAEQFLSM